MSFRESIRVGGIQYSWNSTLTRIDGQARRGFTKIDWSQKLEVVTVPSQRQDAPPLGATAGRYVVDSFAVTMLREQADQLTDYLAFFTPGSSRYGRTSFTFQMTAHEPLQPGARPILLSASPCRIIEHKETTEKGTGVLLTEFSLWTQKLTINGKSLYWKATAGIGGFPGVDSITLGSDVLPGSWVLQPTQKEIGWIIQKPQGQSGATVRPSGDELVSATFLVKFWDESDWNLFQPLRTKYLSRAVLPLSGDLTYAISIVHPELNAIGVKAVVPRKVPVFTNDGTGLWTGLVEFLEYRKPVAAPEAPAAAISAIALPTPSAADAFRQEKASHAAQIGGARG